MKKLSKSSLAVLAHEEKLLKQVVRYCVHLQVGPLEVRKADCNTLSQARDKEREFNQESAFGRRAVVYGITHEGRSVVMLH